MALHQPTVMLWVKTEPCTFGALPVPPHPRLSTHNIKKMVGYAKSKGKSGYPKLNYTVWRHIAQHKLQLPPEYTWMYFNTYHSISDEMSPKQKVELDQKLAACNNAQELDVVRSQTSARLLRFVLFLHLQHLNKTSLRTSLLSVNEEWPMRSRSPDLEGGRSMASSNKGLDEHAHMSFVMQNLSELLELLQEQAADDSVHPDTARLSVEGVEALSLLIDGSTDKLKTLRPLLEIAQMHLQAGSTDLHPRSFSVSRLQAWVRNHMCQNPFGISSCISSGRRLSWPLAGEDRDSRIDTKRGKIATNANVIPKDAVVGNKMIIMSQVCKQTVARSSHTLDGSTVKIHRCHQAYIYLLSPLRSVSIEKCRRSIIVLGPVETTVHMNHCQDCTIIAVTRRITVSSSTQCTLHLMTPSAPLLLHGNQGLTLGPYHTHYPQLETHMAKVGLSSRPNLWDQPLYPGNDGPDRPVVHQLQSPDQCLPFAIPFAMEGPTKGVPGGVPREYEKSWEKRELLVERWQQHVRDSELNKDQKKIFKTLVESQFQEWLKSTGNNRQLDTLAVKKNQS